MNKQPISTYCALHSVMQSIKLNQFCRKWSKSNPNNETIPQNIFPAEVVSVGDYSYGELNVVTFHNKTKLDIGRFVSIAQHVTFLLDVEHHIDHLSTYPFRAKVLGEEEPEAFSKGNIVVHDDVWIGYGATILSGVEIGQGAVIAAGAVVTEDVPPYAVVGGVPAKIIKYRFPENVCDKLQEIKFDKLDDIIVSKSVDLLYEKLDSEQRCLEIIEELKLR